MIEYYRDLADQLSAMPGGHARLREDFFGTLTLPDPSSGQVLTSGKIVETWLLNGEGSLALTDCGDDGTRLVWMRNGGEESIAGFPAGLHEAARQFSITPIGLALLALAMGGVNDEGRLKKLLPDLHKASKGLLLIAVCRLCG